MKRINVVQCQLVKEKTMTYKFKAVLQPLDAVRIIKSFIGNTDRENFVMACLDTKKNITALHTVSIGTINSTCVHPREIFKVAILANSDSILLAHNHPSGDPSPSRADIELTKAIAKAGEILGIQVVDHVVLGDERYVSFKERGLI